MASRTGSGFQPFAEVVESEFLWGRNGPGGLLDAMVNEIGMGTNFHLYGERRSGKSSLLHCAGSLVQRAFPELMPVYLNFRIHNAIVGSANVHRFVVAMLLMHAHSRGLEFFNNDHVQLRLTGEWESMYGRLLAVADYAVPTLVKNCVTEFEERGWGVVLLIDEYEHLMIHSYAGVVGSFFPLRDLSARPYASGRPKALTFVMAGAEPWQDICEMVGSPELNTAISSFDVGPIDPASFEQMWQHCVSECDEQSRIRIQSRKWSALDVFRCAGGWPFFGKVIGHQLLTLELSDADIDELLRPHFDVMWRRLGRSREILVAAENGQAEATTSVRALSRRGLLMEGVDGGFVPCGLAWSRYIREHSADAADLESEREVLNRRRAELLAELDEVKRIVYADDMLRQSLAREFALLAGWAKDCTDVAVIKSAANALSTSRGREAVVVTELCSHLSLQNVVD